MYIYIYIVYTYEVISVMFGMVNITYGETEKGESGVRTGNGEGEVRML
jgi:hypothetical protein